VISVGCAVEWISLAMDLALLKIVSGGGDGGGGEGAPSSGWSAIAAPTLATADDLPRRGGEVDCARFPAAASARRRRRFGARSQFSRPAELESRRGIVAGFHADEDTHHMLSMRVNLSVPMTAAGGDESASNGDDDGGGLVADADGRLVGIVASYSRAEWSGVDVIPGVVIDRFLGLCGRDGAASPPCDGCDASDEDSPKTEDERKGEDEHKGRGEDEREGNKEGDLKMEDERKCKGGDEHKGRGEDERKGKKEDDLKMEDERKGK